MNQNLKKILVTGAALLMFASAGAGLTNNANASHHVGWRQVTRNTSLKVNRGKRINLRKNQRVYVIKLANHQKSAEIKIGRKDYQLNAKLLKQPRIRKSVKRNRANKRYTRKARRYAKRINRRAHNKKRRVQRKRNRRNLHVLRSNFRRSNQRKALRRSGFDGYSLNGEYDILSKYAPNNKRAVIPKKVNIRKVYLWIQTRITHRHPTELAKNPTVYAYVPANHGWVKLSK